MNLNLANKNILVTGSSRGIGAAIVKALLTENARVISNSRGSVEQIQKNQRHFHCQADVTSPAGIDTVKSAVHSFFDGKLDILICNVGSGTSAKPGLENASDWQASFENNFFSTTNVIQALRPNITANSGSILCISSICGIETLGAPLTYSAAKAALNSYVVGLSRVAADSGIRVNAIAPGNIVFPGSVWESKMKDDSEAVQKMLQKEVALKKLGTPEDISNLALFLISEKAQFITGAIIVADGGQVRSW